MNGLRYRKLKEIEPSKYERQNNSQVSMPIPLSELLLDVPLVETEAYIRRPKELREEERIKRHNFPRIPRPMNVFLLYRRAVSERAKGYAGVTNHQAVSRIAAASWKNESDGVKDIFVVMLTSKRSITIRHFQITSSALKKLNPRKLASAKGKRKTAKIQMTAMMTQSIEIVTIYERKERTSERNSLQVLSRILSTHVSFI